MYIIHNKGILHTCITQAEACFYDGSIMPSITKVVANHRNLPENSQRFIMAPVYQICTAVCFHWFLKHCCQIDIIKNQCHLSLIHRVLDYYEHRASNLKQSMPCEDETPRCFKVISPLCLLRNLNRIVVIW